MSALYDHIQALRAELRSCHLTRHERAEIEAELTRAVARKTELDRAFGMVFDAENHCAEASK